MKKFKVPGSSRFLVPVLVIALVSAVVLVACSITNQTFYYDNGEYVITKYDKNDNILKETYYSIGSSEKYWYTCEYDENGNRVKQIFHNTDGSYSITEYDENGNKVKTTIYNADGSIDCISEYGENEKTTHYNADGSIEYWYAYDENGDWTKYFPNN